MINFSLFIYFRFCELLDRNSIPFFLFYAANRWLAVFLDSMTIVVTGATGFLVIFTLNAENSSQAGLALSFAIQVSYSRIMKLLGKMQKRNLKKKYFDAKKGVSFIHRKVISSTNLISQGTHFHKKGGKFEKKKIIPIKVSTILLYQPLILTLLFLLRLPV